jgi:ubiquinone biosynthesis protein
MNFTTLNYEERQRLREILSILRVHGFKEGFKSIKDAAQVRRTLEILGPSFVKIGQLLSLRPDLLPPDFIKELETLQDNVAPEPFATIEQVITSELGRSPSELFDTFEATPIACASIAVVHKATLKNGDVVAVKVQRPQVKERLLLDLALLKKFSPLAKIFLPGDSVDPREFADELYQTLKTEIDFLHEAHNMQRFYDLNCNEENVVSPHPYQEFCTEKVLVMQFLDGINFRDIDEVRARGHDIEKLIHIITTNYIKQVFEDGFCHADPHPGNIMVVGDKVAYIDFGLTVEIKRSLRSKINDFIIAIGTRDIDKLTQTTIRLCNKKADIDYFALHADLELIYNKYISDSLQDVDVTEFIKESLEITRKHRLSIPREVVLLLKGTSTLEGMIVRYAPNLNTNDIIEPYVKARIAESINLRNEFQDQAIGLFNLYRSGMKIPVKLYDVMNNMVAGRIRFGVIHHNLDRLTATLESASNKLALAVLTAGIAIGSAVLMASSTGTAQPLLSQVAALGLGTAAALALLLVVLILKRSN